MILFKWCYHQVTLIFVIHQLSEEKDCQKENNEIICPIKLNQIMPNLWNMAIKTIESFQILTLCQKVRDLLKKY
jgi:hypothetical protein